MDGAEVARLLLERAGVTVPAAEYARLVPFIDRPRAEQDPRLASEPAAAYRPAAWPTA